MGAFAGAPGTVSSALHDEVPFRPSTFHEATSVGDVLLPDAGGSAFEQASTTTTRAAVTSRTGRLETMQDLGLEASGPSARVTSETRPCEARNSDFSCSLC